MTTRTTRRLRMAIVGCGFMGRRHLSGYAALHRAGLDTVEVAAVMDLDPAAAERAADLAAGLLGRRPLVHTTLDDLLVDPAVDALDVVTEPRTHHSIVVAALEAGRDVLCEKPLALTVRTGRTMVEAARQTGRTLATAENYRRGGANRIARAVIDAGLLGRIHLMHEFHVGGDDRVIISPWRHRKDSGSIGLDMGIHYADIIEYYLGPVAQVHGRGLIAEPLRRPADGGPPVVATGEDSLLACLRTAGGVEVQLTYLPSGPGHAYGRRTVHGSLGSMEVPADRSDGRVVVHLADRTLTGAELVTALGPAFRLPGATAAVLGPDGTGGVGADFATVDAGYLAVEIEDFADAVLHQRPPEVDGGDGLRSLAVVHAILESGVAQRTVSVDEVLDGSLHTYQDEIDRALGAVA